MRMHGSKDSYAVTVTFFLFLVSALALGGCGDDTASECPEGQVDCSGRCVDLQSDIADCGSCGNGCTVANGTPECSEGLCSVASCTTPYDDCDGSYETGCEADLNSDPQNCGGCGNACGDGQPCEAGSCVDQCSGGLTDCGGACVDLLDDPSHCGGCGQQCSAANGTPGCSDGSCAIASCSAPYEDCDGIYETGCEVNTDQDPLRCGGCGIVCSVASGTPECSNGSCAIASCSAPYDDCDGSYETGCEVDTSSDTEHCGGCGSICSAVNGTPECPDGSCAIASCSAPYDDCDGSYETGCEVNTDQNPSYCGGCGVACDVAGGEVCLVGSCEMDCGGLTDCDGSCVDILSELAHCGGCGQQCTVSNGTAGCAGGNCTVAGCAAPYADCDGGYETGCEVDTSSDAGNCDGCGIVCTVASGTPECSDGSCAIASCTSPYDDCDASYETGCEVNTDQDPANCGGCGVACDVAGGEVCLAGFCEIDCGVLINCDGACVDTTSDPANCGVCGEACVYSNAVGTCNGGTCEMGDCEAGFANCNDDDSDGREIPLGTVDDCGACADDCVYANAAGTCNAGTCEMGACEAGFANCNDDDSDGCEIATDSDPANCGDCDVACDVAGGEACLAGSCVLDCGALTNCNGSCVDTTSDSDNCGGCGDACMTTTRICEASQCLTGGFCIHVGEMDAGGRYEDGPAYVTVCDVCALGDFSLCPRYYLCDYFPPSCGGCITGLPDGTYEIAAFIDSGADSDPADPLPDSGDGLPSDGAGNPVGCATDTISGGAVIGPVNIFVRYVIP